MLAKPISLITTAVVRRHLELLLDALNLCLVGGARAMQPPASLGSMQPNRHNTSLQQRADTAEQWTHRMPV
jgi:hypothetical protein